MKTSWKVHHFIEYYLKASVPADKDLGFDNKGHVYVIAQTFEETVSDTVAAYNKAIDRLEEDRRYSFYLNGQYELFNEAIFEQKSNNVDRSKYFTEERLKPIMNAGGFKKEEFAHIYSVLVRNGLFVRILVELKEQLSFMSFQKNVVQILKGVDDFVLSQEQNDAQKKEGLKAFLKDFVSEVRSHGWLILRTSPERLLFWIPFMREIDYECSKMADLQNAYYFHPVSSSEGRDCLWGFSIFMSSVSYRQDAEKALRLLRGEEI